MSKISKNKADRGRRTTSKAAKVALTTIGISLAAGTALVVGMDRVMKKIFVNEDWPDEEWSSDDWAGEDLEG